MREAWVVVETQGWAPSIGPKGPQKERSSKVELEGPARGRVAEVIVYRIRMFMRFVAPNQAPKVLRAVNAPQSKLLTPQKRPYVGSGPG